MSKERVLVVDDELDNRVMMRYFLESWGYEVELAANGQEALEKVAANPPHLVLLDLEMPVMDGFDTCDRLKSNDATEQIPVIMFTGLEQTADKVRGIRKGADDYVVKTVDPEELQARIEMILRRTKRYDAPAAAGGTAQKPQDSHAVSGSLSELYFPETMQLIMAYGKTGVLNLQDGDREGKVYLKNGNVAHATFKDFEGNEAFYNLALWKSGHFSFQVGEKPPKTTIKMSGTNLLIEATRRLDEWNMISSKIPNFDVVPARVALSEAESIRLTRDDWQILLQMDGRRSIRQIAERLEMDLFETGRIVFNLLTVGVVSLDIAPKPKCGPRFNVIPTLVAEIAQKEPFQFSAEQWRLIIEIDGQITVNGLSETLGIPAQALATKLKELQKMGFVRFIRVNGSSEKPARKSAPSSTNEDGAPEAGNVEAYQSRIRAVGLD
jgi:CheY-like chemotaxis protein/predicted transcriptional regulator